MVAHFSPSLRWALIVGATAVMGLSACNKLGYGEVRTAPEGQAMLGPKRMPMLNQQEIQKQRTMGAMQQPQQQMPAYSQPPMQIPMMAPSMSPMPQMTPQAMMQPEAEPLPYQPTPYSNSAQSYAPPPAPQPTPQLMPETVPESASEDQGSYELPYNFPAGSYYQTGAAQQQAPALLQTSSGMPTDYYGKDMRQAPAAAPMPWNQGYPQPQQAPAPMNQGYATQLPPYYSTGYQYGATGAAYSGYNEAPVPVMPSGYQPMTARQANSYPAIDPYATPAMAPEYDNLFYGGQGMPQMQPQPMMSPQSQATPAAASGQDLSYFIPDAAEGYSQQPAARISPVASRRLLGAEESHRSLEEPPMLSSEYALPNPQTPYQPYYGGY